jgi:surfactin synthase thioesterase subunit
MRLFCFPHAGGHSLAFRQWPHGLPEWVEVVSIQLPGRANRLRERPIASMNELVGHIMRALDGDTELPFAFFGHSMGAILAWAVTHGLADASRPLPRHLIVSGRRGPRVAEREPKLSGLTDAAFIAAIKNRYGGIPDELARHADVMDVLLPPLRADIAAIEGLELPAATRLPIPISAFGGRDDWMITRDDLAAWSDETSCELQLRVYPGGHFYLEEQRAALLAEITRVLAACTDDRQKEVTT